MPRVAGSSTMCPLPPPCTPRSLPIPVSHVLLRVVSGDLVFAAETKDDDVADEELEAATAMAGKDEDEGNDDSNESAVADLPLEAAEALAREALVGPVDPSRWCCFLQPNLGVVPTLLYCSEGSVCCSFGLTSLDSALVWYAA